MWFFFAFVNILILSHFSIIVRAINIPILYEALNQVKNSTAA